MNNDLQNALLNASLNEEEIKTHGTEPVDVMAPAAP